MATKEKKQEFKEKLLQDVEEALNEIFSWNSPEGYLKDLNMWFHVILTSPELETWETRDRINFSAMYQYLSKFINDMANIKAALNDLKNKSLP